jgi:hypothetical protein
VPDWDAMYGNLRRGPWADDPNALPQEIGARNGNIESQGWIADNSVTADVIQANAVIAAKIQAGAITTDKLAANAVTADKIAANTITANEIAANAITTSELNANAVTAAKIAANTITANEIAANTLTASEIAANAITTSELSADSVTTAKIVAANVTSSRIEAVISGKEFSGVSGTESAPGYYFDASGDMGLWRVSSTQAAISAGGTRRMAFGSSNISYVPMSPSSAGTFDFGLSGSRWNTVYCVALNQSSDERLKQDIADETLGLDFIRTLRPVTFRWKDTPDTQAQESVSVDEAALARECRPHEQRIERIRADQLTGKISDEDAAVQVADARAKITEITERHVGPVRDAQQKRRPGRRLHHGLIGQEVKAALDAADVDAAFWQQDAEGNQSLSYTELTIPLLRAVQELAAANESLTARVAQLEGAA